MASVVLDDRTGRIEVTVFSELYEKVRDLLAADRILAVTGSLNFDEYRDSWSLRANEVRTLEAMREAAADHILLRLDLGDPAAHAKGQDLIGRLRETLAAYKGGKVAVQIDYRRRGAGVRLVLGDDWRVQPTDELLKRLRHLLGADAAQVAYQRFVPPRPAAQEPRPRLVAVS
jgi:DNA polymerase-3 subunit alpha